MMIQMIVSAQQVMWKKEFLVMLRERNRRSKEYAQHMKKLRQKHGPDQHWWH